MKYMGSKARHAKEILPIILSGRQEGQWYVEPFVGGANVIDKVDGNRIGSDQHFYLIKLLDAMSNYDHWIPPWNVSEEDYKAGRGLDDPVLKAYIGFCLSYGGKWFGGYRRDKDGKRNYSLEAYKNYMTQAPKLCGVKFMNCDYFDLEIPPNSIIYCDPPYQGTTGYATGAFDHEKFWQWCRDKFAEGHRVYVSEYTAPDDWVSVWEKTVNNTLTKDTGSKKGVEKLFVMRGHEPKVGLF
jgi:DNA adenine methylase